MVLTGLNRVSSPKQAINDKMQVLSDFGICSRNDKGMRAKLEQVIAENPKKNPREVLDYFCRPMIRDIMDSWR